MNVKTTATLLVLAPVLLGCGDTVGSEDALRSHGYSEVYVAGYHDGCESGQLAGGDNFAQRLRDQGAYDSGSDYKTGWDYGFVTCRDQEARNLAIANAIAAGIATSSSHGADGIDTRKMLDGIDTSAIQAAGW